MRCRETTPANVSMWKANNPMHIMNTRFAWYTAEPGKTCMILMLARVPTIITVMITVSVSGTIITKNLAILIELP